MSRWERFKKMNRAIWHTFKSSIPYTLPFFLGQALGFEHTDKTPALYWTHAVLFYLVLLLSIWILLMVIYYFTAGRFKENP